MSHVDNYWQDDWEDFCTPCIVCDLLTDSTLLYADHIICAPCHDKMMGFVDFLKASDAGGCE